MSNTRWAILGGLLGAGAVTGVGVYLAVKDLQSPETQARAQAEAQRMITEEFGLTPTRLTQITAIARRFGAT